VIEELLRYIEKVFSFDPETPLLFTQMQFWVFFVLVFTLFSIIVSLPQSKSKGHSRQLMRNCYLLLVSLLFYYKTSGWFVGLLLLVTCTDFYIARGIYYFRFIERHLRVRSIMPRLLLILSVTIDLGILCYFKYAYFFTDLFNQATGSNVEVCNIAAEAGNWIVGRPLWSIENIILPVGISFYTFQVISYTADVYRGLIKPVHNITDFGFYVSFFPQLVAGPIVKASDFIPQLYKPYHLSRLQFGVALFWLLNGMAKKIILSDYLAINFIDRVFANPLLFSGFENLSALFGYSLQLYADFSGYTDMAIGLSMLMGFYLPKNFNSPYKAENLQNFWKRWHISLSSWLQNYLYIPLGGNRTAFGLGRDKLPQSVIYGINCMITMLLGGLWHGASLNFVVWGGLHGVGLLIVRLWNNINKYARATGWCSALVLLLLMMKIFPELRPLLNVIGVMAICIPLLTWCKTGKILFNYFFVTFAWLFFRAGSNLDPASANERAWAIASQMIHQIGSRWSVNPLEVITAYPSVFTLLIAGMVAHWLPNRFKRIYRLRFARLPLPFMAFVTIIVVFIIYQFVSAEMQPFIYFQF